MEQLRLLGQQYQREFELGQLSFSPKLEHPSLPLSRELNTSRVSSIHNALENLRIEDVRKSSDLKVNFDQKTKFSTDSGLVYVVETGNLDENFYMRLSAELNAEVNSQHNSQSQKILTSSKLLNSNQAENPEEEGKSEEGVVSSDKEDDSVKEYQPVPLVAEKTIEKINKKHANWVYQVAEFTGQKFRHGAGAMSQLIQQ